MYTVLVIHIIVADMTIPCISLGTRLIGSTIIVIVQQYPCRLYRHAYARMCTCSCYNYTVKTDRCISLETLMNRALQRVVPGENCWYRSHQARRLGGSVGSVGPPPPPPPPPPRSSELVPLAIKIIYSLLLYMYSYSPRE